MLDSVKNNKTNVANGEFAARLSELFNFGSAADIARKIQVPHATVSNYLRGRLPSADVLIKIADETNVSLNWLLTGEGEKFVSRDDRQELSPENRNHLQTVELFPGSATETQDAANEDSLAKVFDVTVLNALREMMRRVANNEFSQMFERADRILDIQGETLIQHPELIVPNRIHFGLNDVEIIARYHERYPSEETASGLQSVLAIYKGARNRRRNPRVQTNSGLSNLRIESDNQFFESGYDSSTSRIATVPVVKANQNDAENQHTNRVQEHPRRRANRGGK